MGAGRWALNHSPRVVPSNTVAALTQVPLVRAQKSKVTLLALAKGGENGGKAAEVESRDDERPGRGMNRIRQRDEGMARGWEGK
jgi:hypothetical protein